MSLNKAVDSPKDKPDQQGKQKDNQVSADILPQNVPETTIPTAGKTKDKQRLLAPSFFKSYSPDPPSQ